MVSAGTGHLQRFRTHPKRIDELGGEVRYEAHGVCKYALPTGWEHHSPEKGVQRRKQLVLDVNLLVTYTARNTIWKMLRQTCKVSTCQRSTSQENRRWRNKTCQRAWEIALKCADMGVTGAGGAIYLALSSTSPGHNDYRPAFDQPLHACCSPHKEASRLLFPALV
jgi:hypothetical protein